MTIATTGPENNPRKFSNIQEWNRRGRHFFSGGVFLLSLPMFVVGIFGQVEVLPVAIASALVASAAEGSPWLAQRLHRGSIERLSHWVDGRLGVRPT